MLAALAIWGSDAHAQTDCQHTFRAELTRLRGVPADERYRAEFRAEGDALHVTLRAPDGSARELRGPDCSALASAAAVAVALMLDAEPPPPAPRPRTLTAGAGTGLLLGIPRDLAPALLAELGLRSQSWRLGMGIAWALPRHSDFGPGAIRSELIAGSVRLCVALLPHLSLCSGSYLGRLDMRAEGYTRNERARSFWGAAPLELALDYLWAHVGGELGLGALIPYQRRQFSIDGLGEAQRAWPVQALFALRLFGTKNL